MRPRELISRAVGRIDHALFPAATSGDDQWQRVVMNYAIDTHIHSLDPPGLAAAEISGDSHAHRPWREFTSLNYPAFDLCEPVDEELSFDVVICEQVLEHVVDPCAAARHLRDLVRPGGHVIVSTPFLIKVHELALFGMMDYWRFTPRGLEVLLENAGLDVLSVAAWGNRSCVTGNFRRWPAYRRWHSLRNDPELAVQVWAYARRPADPGTDA